MDRILFIAISLISIVTVLVVGDALYIGLWYYIAIPLVAYLLTLPFKPKQFFLTGISLAILLTYIPYFYHNLFAERPEGLLGLGHLFSLPGLAVAIVLVSLYLKAKTLSPILLFTISFIGALFGYLINQFIVCNTVIYCGSLIWPVGLLSIG